MEAIRRIDEIALETGFSGAVRVDDGDEILFERAYGLADRRWAIPNEPETRFAIASGTKGLTALTVVTLIEEGVLALDTPARTFLGDDLRLIADDVTLEHLLGHRSGIGDYLDEDQDLDLTEYLLAVPAHRLDTTESYLAVLDGFASKFDTGERFSYSNSGYVVLALIAERASGVPFHELVVQRVCRRAGMHNTEFLRSDQLPERTAIGYLDDGRTNVFHLPVRGSGDGGIYTTLADVRALWASFFAGRIVGPAWVEEMVRPRSDRYGLGFWLDEGRVRLEGMDAGVSFLSLHDAGDDRTWTVVSNTSTGAWPIARALTRPS